MAVGTFLCDTLWKYSIFLLRCFGLLENILEGDKIQLLSLIGRSIPSAFHKIYIVYI